MYAAGQVAINLKQISFPEGDEASVAKTCFVQRSVSGMGRRKNPQPQHFLFPNRVGAILDGRKAYFRLVGALSLRQVLGECRRRVAAPRRLRRAGAW